MATGSLATLFWLTFIMIVLFAVAGILQSLRSIVLQQASDWLHDEITATALPLMLAQTSSAEPNGAQAMRDAGALKHFLSGPALVTLMDAPWAILYIVVLFVIHSLLGLLDPGRSRTVAIAGVA